MLNIVRHLKLKKMKIDLKEATLEDWKLLLDWRNDIATRKNSHNIDLVKEEDHKAWLCKVIKNSNRKLFIAYQNKKPVGTARADYDELEKNYELSWTVAPNSRGKGIGKHMVKCLADVLKTKIRAEIKKGNTSSIRIAEYAGMNFKGKKGEVLYYSN